ncbi:hypothetical protein ACFP3Q_09765 [Nocardioides sp. GCM10027113]|uniref:hypothetical protein n=1 Tax=unclassified Nocardioides TaxID=2615069 RepID=UPI003614952C
MTRIPEAPRGAGIIASVLVVCGVLCGLLVGLPAQAEPQAAHVWAARTSPAAPVEVRPVATAPTRLTVAWSAMRSATKYRIDHAADSAMRYRRTSRRARPQLTMRLLQPDTSYWVRVRVVRVDGERNVGPWSDVVEVRTTPAPTGKALFGANYSTMAHVDERVYGGRAGAARVFFQELDRAQFSTNSAVREALADGVSTFVISWKETDRAAIQRFLAGIPGDLTVYTTFNHEPENDHGSLGSAEYRAWSAEYRRQWSLQSPLMRAEGMIPTSILMGWTLDPRSGRDIADWTPPEGTVDVFAFDAYYGKGQDPHVQVGRMVAATEAAGLATTGLAETGAPVGDPDRPSATAAMKDAVTEAGMFAWALYWNGAEGGYDARMSEDIADIWFG